jgi:hypothetical protein
MPKRSTIQKNPLEELGETKSKEAAPPVDAGQPAAGDLPGPGRDALAKLKAMANRTIGDRGGESHTDRVQRAKGGWLELLGGSLGTGRASISSYGKNRRLGFTVQGEFIDLESTIDTVEAMSDRGEHRLLSAAGWAWMAGILFGPAGVALGGGVRLLHPRKMVVNIRFRDGRTIVARTDSITAAALQEIAAVKTKPEDVQTA